MSVVAPDTPTRLAPGTSVPHLVRFTGAIQNVAPGPRTVTFAIYRDEQGGSPLWSETQSVTTDATGHYSVLLGSANGAGLPAEALANGDASARWLSISIEGASAQPRLLLVSVPFALKAEDADKLGGKTAGDFATQDDLRAAIHSIVIASSSAAGENQGTSQAGSSSSGFDDRITRNNASLTIKQSSMSGGGPGIPTDFSDTSSVEVMRIDQFGSGAALIVNATAANRAMQATSAGTSPATIEGTATAASGTAIGVQGDAVSPNGIGVYGKASSTSGNSTGVRGDVLSPTGAAVVGVASDASTTGSAVGVYGLSTSAVGAGVNGQASGASGIGVHGASLSTTGQGVAVQADVNSASAVGVLANSVSSAATLFAGTSNGTLKFAVDGSGDIVANGNVAAASVTAGTITATTINAATVTGNFDAATLGGQPASAYALSANTVSKAGDTMTGALVVPTISAANGLDPSGATIGGVTINTTQFNLYPDHTPSGAGDYSTSTSAFYRASSFDPVAGAVVPQAFSVFSTGAQEFGVSTARTKIKTSTASKISTGSPRTFFPNQQGPLPAALHWGFGSGDTTGSEVMALDSTGQLTVGNGLYLYGGVLTFPDGSTQSTAGAGSGISNVIGNSGIIAGLDGSTAYFSLDGSVARTDSDSGFVAPQTFSAGINTNGINSSGEISTSFYFSGNAAGLFNIPGYNVVGTVPQSSMPSIALRLQVFDSVGNDLGDYAGLIDNNGGNSGAYVVLYAGYLYGIDTVTGAANYDTSYTVYYTDSSCTVGYLDVSVNHPFPQQVFSDPFGSPIAMTGTVQSNVDAAYEYTDGGCYPVNDVPLTSAVAVTFAPTFPQNTGMLTIGPAPSSYYLSSQHPAKTQH